MNHDAILREIARNLDHFQRNLAAYLAIQPGRFALLHDAAVIDFYDDVGSADREGASRFADGIYSIQQVTNEPVELGVYANAADWNGGIIGKGCCCRS